MKYQIGLVVLLMFGGDLWASQQMRCYMTTKKTMLKASPLKTSRTVRELPLGVIVRRGQRTAVGYQAWFDATLMLSNTGGWIAQNDVRTYPCTVVGNLKRSPGLVGRWLVQRKGHSGMKHASLELDRTGSYRYAKAGMDMVARLLEHTGRWAVYNNQLFLQTKSEHRIIGGSVKACDLSFYKGNCLTGGKNLKTVVAEPLWRYIGRVVTQKGASKPHKIIGSTANYTRQ